MAKTRLGNATYVKYGYGQVEPNHLSAQRTGQIYAQLPADKNITLLENGQFVKYNYAANKVDFAGPGEWMLVFNEVKVYEDRQSNCDFAMKADDYDYYVYDAAGHSRNADTQSPMVPRVFKTNIGDIFTTNCVKAETLAAGDYLQVGKDAEGNYDGYLAKVDSADDSEMTWQVVKVYTTPDMQPGVKIMRVY